MCLNLYIYILTLVVIKVLKVQSSGLDIGKPLILFIKIMILRFKIDLTTVIISFNVII